MSAYTPGPLTVRETISAKPDDRGDHAIVDSEGKIIGEAFARVGYSDHRPALSNATLWAAAAEMLEALEGAALTIHAVTCAQVMCHPSCVQARSAIAKAKGETP